MKDTLSALVAYGKQEILSPAGFCTTIFFFFAFLLYSFYISFCILQIILFLMCLLYTFCLII